MHALVRKSSFSKAQGLHKTSPRAPIAGKQGAVALTIGSVLRGTILNYVIFIGRYRGQQIQQPIKMT